MENCIWSVYKIKELGEVITGNTPPTSKSEYYGTQYKFIKPTDMIEGQRYVLATEQYYSELAYEKYKKSLLPPKTPCVVTIGSLGKKMCLTDTECFTNQAVNAVIPNKNNNGEFLYYAFKAQVLAYVKQLDSGTASGRENVSKSSFSNIKVRVPILSVQTKIASILSAYDDLIEKNNRRMEILRGCAEELYKEWFVRFRFPNWQNTKFINGIPQGWGYGKIGDLCKIKNGFAFSSSDFLDKGDFGIIKIENVLFGDVQIDKCQYISDIDENKLKSFRLHSNDILIAMTGAQIGKTGRFPVVDKIFYLNQRVGKFIPNNPNIVNNHYLYQYTQTKSFITFIENYANGAAQPNISGKQIENIKILIPTNKLLQEYELRVDNILNSIQLLKNQNELLKQQRDLLLPRLMSGKINVTP